MSNGDFEHQENFWTHGVNTIVEFPERVLVFQQAGWGTLVQQDGGTENWFHIPLHTPSFIPSGLHGGLLQQCQPYVARLAGAMLKARLNERAVIREIHLRAGQRLIASQTADFRNMDVCQIITTRTAQAAVQIIEGDGIALCVKVVFLEGNPVGQAIFYGAGSYYNHAL